MKKDAFARQALRRRVDGEAAKVRSYERASETCSRDERRAAAAHQVGDQLAWVAGDANDSFQQSLGFLRGVAGPLLPQRGVGDHRRNVGPHAAEPATLVGEVAVGFAADGAVAESAAFFGAGA